MEQLSLLHIPYNSMKESFDPGEEDMHKVPSSKLDELFVPIEEVPDSALNPLEALIAKEEGAEKKDTVDHHSNGHADKNDLSRVPSYLRKSFDEDKEMLPPEVVVNQPPPADGEIEQNEKRQDAKAGLRPDPIGRQRPFRELKNGKFAIIDSHGNRGRKPSYKDKPRQNEV